MCLRAALGEWWALCARGLVKDHLAEEAARRVRLGLRRFLNNTNLVKDALEL